jgi:hypothetical protein
MSQEENGHTDTWEAYRYDPSTAAAALFAALFFLVTFLHLWQLIKTRTWVFIPFVIGGMLESVGYVGVCSPICPMTGR